MNMLAISLWCAEQGLTFQSVSQYLLNTHDMLLTASMTLTHVFFGPRSVVLALFFVSFSFLSGGSCE